MDNVRNRYEMLCTGLKYEMPQRYKTRKYSFCKDIEKRLGEKGKHVRPLNKGPLLLYPGEKSEFIIAI